MPASTLYPEPMKCKREVTSFGHEKIQRLIWGGIWLGLWGLYAQKPARYALYERAQYWTQQKRWDSALAHWRTLLLIEKDSAAQALIHQQLGYIALHRGDSAEALRLWKRSLTFQPQYAIALRNYQWLYTKLRRPPSEIPPPYSVYAPMPTLSERAPPHMGERPPRIEKSVQWLPVVRLRD